MNLANMNILNPYETLYLNMTIRRDNIVQDTLDRISGQNMNFRLPLKIKFVGEEGIDEGGIRKEFFQIMISQLINLDYAMFIPKNVKKLKKIKY